MTDEALMQAFEAGQGSSESGPEVLMTWASPEGVSTWPLGGSLSRGLLPDPLPTQARFFATPPVASPAERWLGRAVTVQTASEHMLLASRSLWNLLQFELAPRSKGAHALSDQWRHFMSPTWRPVRVGLAALVVVQVLGLNVWAWHQQHTLKSRQAQRVQLLQQAHPQVRVVLDAPVQMQRETDTRYLIVTHNAVTMSRMHRLFGVTTIEKGVSRLVSVELGGAEALAAE